MRHCLLLFVSLIACQFLSANETVIEIYYFYSDHYCPSDVQIQQETRTIVESAFAKELEEGKIVLKYLNFMSPENQVVAEKFEIGWSSLIINKRGNGQEEAINMNDFAFTNVPSNPEKFKAGLEEKIRELLE